MGNMQIIFLISACIICKLVSSVSATATILKFENDDLELPCRRGSSSVPVFWIGPHSHVIRRGDSQLSPGNNASLLNLIEEDPTVSHPPGNKYFINENGSLVIQKLQTTDAGKFLCMSAAPAAAQLSQKGSQQPEILDEYYLPYVIVRKNHLKSFYTAIAISGGFFITAMCVYLLSEFTRKGRDSASNAIHPEDDHVTPYNSAVKNDIIGTGYRGADKKSPSPSSYANQAYTKTDPNDYSKYLGTTDTSSDHVTPRPPTSVGTNGNGYHWSPKNSNNADKGFFINTIQITDTPM